MSGEAKAPRKRPARYVHCTRPDTAPENHPIPRRGWDVRHAVPLRAAIVYQTLASLKPVSLPQARDGKPRGSVVTNTSNVRVKLATARFMPTMTSALQAEAMPLRTVGHCIDDLIGKGLIDRWDTETRSRHSPTGSSYRLVPWGEVLARWAQDPKIATAEGTLKGFYIWGKGKKFLTPDDVIAWKVDPVAAETQPSAQAGAAALEDPTAKPAAAKAPWQPPAPPADGELEELTVALIRVTGAAELKDARYIWGAVAAACSTGAIPPVMDVASMVYAIGDQQRQIGNRNPITVELVKMRIGGRVAAWALFQQEEAQAATGTGGRRPGFSPGDPRA